MNGFFGALSRHPGLKKTYPDIVYIYIGFETLDPINPISPRNPFFGLSFLYMPCRTIYIYIGF